ncbi:MAG: metallophosphoesterase, partial [Kiritimatiellia bacterium]|nr:metallophosphoesterase [Kiritimatiellia bacterium]
MTRFLYLTDTHLGAGREGYIQQSRYLELFDRLLAGLRTWISENKVDFIIHGGDLTEDGTGDQIKKSIAVFKTLNIPFYLCLGNHDLSGLKSISLWLDHHEGAFADGTPNFTVETGEVVLFVMAHHWDTLSPAHYWNRDLPQVPILDEAQKAKFESLLKSTVKPVIVAVHAPLNAVPASQTGLAADFHVPARIFLEYFLGLAEKYPNFKLALAAHNHVNTLVNYGKLTTVTSAAFSEAPFDFRMIEVGPEAIAIKTISLNSHLRLSVNYLAEKTCVQGAEGDCSGSIILAP